MGDTLAGLLGALTLIWIIASVFHQSKELADQRVIMREQKKEFELMAKAQEAQVEALNAQILILQDEKRRRDEYESDKEFDALVNVVLGVAQRDGFSNITYVLTKFPAPPGLERCEFPVFQTANGLRMPADPAACVREVVWSVCVAMRNSVRAHKENGYTLEENPQLQMELRSFRDALAEIEGKISKLSAAGKVKARSIDAIGAVRSLDAALSELSPLVSGLEADRK
jgi:hypothetical protein